jgi:hypothetical protein
VAAELMLSCCLQQTAPAMMESACRRELCFRSSQLLLPAFDTHAMQLVKQEVAFVDSKFTGQLQP